MKSCLWCYWLDVSMRDRKVARKCEECNQLTKSNFLKRGRHHENEKKNK